MSVAELDEPREARAIPSRLERVPASVSSVPSSSVRRRHLPWMLSAAWIIAASLIGYYGYNLYRIGMDAREGFWVYWEQNRFQGDLRNAVGQSNAVLREAEQIASEDLQAMTPEARAAQQSLNGGQPALTLMSPGPGLFSPPWSPRIMLERWRRLKPVYSQLYRGWVRTYDRLEKEVPSGEYDLDYPPLRLLVMTLWTWKIESAFPGLSDYPSNPQQFTDPITKRTVYATQDVVRPILILNRSFDMLSTVSMFFLVWVWSNRMPVGSRRASGLARVPGFGWLRERDLPLSLASAGWRTRWGDPLLVLPAILLLIGNAYVRPYLNFNMAVSLTPGQSYIDDRVSSLGWWLFVILRFIAVISLARLLPRPFRGPVCGMVAATLVWLNPASILDSFGWPQYDVWLPPFFLLAALLVSVDWWLTAGAVLGIGCMFKGQLLFVSPILLLCPLFAGWFGRFLRVTAGMALGMALVVWPWLVRNDSAKAYMASAVFAAVVVCLVSLARKPIWRETRRALNAVQTFGRNRWQQWRGDTFEPSEAPLLQRSTSLGMLRLDLWIAVAIALCIAAVLTLQIHRHQPDHLHRYTILLAAAVLVLPWYLPRRKLVSFVAIVFTASLWLAAFSLSGGFSWWSVGFLYGTQKHQNMQLGSQSLSNLSSVLEKRYRWQLHDLVGTLRTTDLVIPQLLNPRLAFLTFAASTIVAIAASTWLYVRRRSTRALPLIGGAWVLISGLSWLLVKPRTLLATGSYEWDVQTSAAILFGLTLLPCAIGAGIHLRRRDPRFLVALTAPWMLFVALLTQLAARYTILPSIVAACLVGVSVGMSLFQLLLVTIACAMLGNQMINFNTQIAPLTQMITRPTHPDLGWVQLLLAGIFLFAALLPSRKARVAALS